MHFTEVHVRGFKAPYEGAPCARCREVMERRFYICQECIDKCEELVGGMEISMVYFRVRERTIDVLSEPKIGELEQEERTACQLLLTLTGINVTKDITTGLLNRDPELSEMPKRAEGAVSDTIMWRDHKLGQIRYGWSGAIFLVWFEPAKDFIEIVEGICVG